MAEYLTPGVYAEEFDSGAKHIEGVGTSTAGFVGMAQKGPLEGLPELVTNFSDFMRIYGGYLSASEYGDYRFLAYAVEHFFVNGGSRAYIVRVASPDAVCAGAEVSAAALILRITAKNPGLWGNRLRVTISPSENVKTQIYEEGELLPQKTIESYEFNMEIHYEDLVETFKNLSFNIETPSYVEKKLAKSELISVSVQEGKGAVVSPYEQLAGDTQVLSVELSGGSDGNPLAMTAADFIGTDNGEKKRTGIQAFLDNDVVSVIAVPGVTDSNVQLSLVAHCEKLESRFAVLDIPQNAKKIQDILDHRNIFDTTYAALYHPWLLVFDPLEKRNSCIPPSGSVMGIYARSDSTKGVHKAPANEVVRSCVGLDVQFGNGEQDILNPMGVNLIRAFPGMGIRVWGARTASRGGNWKYINVRRLFIFLEESIRANTNWVVFEPNDEMLWGRVQRTIEAFLESLWRGGSLAGNSPAEAFFVNIGRTTMTQDDIDNGRLICVIGVAPVKPAEFVIFRITQKTGDAR